MPATWEFIMLVERQLDWNKFIIVCLKIFSSVRQKSLHNESDLSFVRFIAQANFRMGEWNVVFNSWIARMRKSEL